MGRKQTVRFASGLGFFQASLSQGERMRVLMDWVEGQENAYDDGPMNLV